MGQMTQPSMWGWESTCIMFELVDRHCFSSCTLCKSICIHAVCWVRSVHARLKIPVERENSDQNTLGPAIIGAFHRGSCSCLANINVVGCCIDQLDFIRCVQEFVRWFVQPVQQRLREVDEGDRLLDRTAMVRVVKSHSAAKSVD